MTLPVALLMFGFLIVAQCCTPEPGAVNVARNGTASQSSDQQFRVMGYASKAIDGNTEGDFHKGFCTHTKDEYEPWWDLDLKKTYNISSIVITNRRDCCAQRLLGAEVRIGDSPDRKNPVCSNVTDVSKPRISLCCSGMLGRYVSVEMTERLEVLTLCEVEVYGKEKVAMYAGNTAWTVISGNVWRTSNLVIFLLLYYFITNLP
ncbi:fucolectin-like [Rana temporaria]|uniref:fucolectin-like n=1 Tax=Rana temporaria TaxID=8407 RepID=UPI001AADD173|nr:fucolectin-like [Rana temporaria]